MYLGFLFLRGTNQQTYIPGNNIVIGPKKRSGGKLFFEFLSFLTKLRSSKDRDPPEQWSCSSFTYRIPVVQACKQEECYSQQGTFRYMSYSLSTTDAAFSSCRKHWKKPKWNATQLSDMLHSALHLSTSMSSPESQIATLTKTANYLFFTLLRFELRKTKRLQVCDLYLTKVKQ